MIVIIISTLFTNSLVSFSQCVFGLRTHTLAHARVNYIDVRKKAASFRPGIDVLDMGNCFSFALQLIHAANYDLLMIQADSEINLSGRGVGTVLCTFDSAESEILISYI